MAKITPVMPATKPAASCRASSLARAVSILSVLPSIPESPRRSRAPDEPQF